MAEKTFAITYASDPDNKVSIWCNRGSAEADDSSWWPKKKGRIPKGARRFHVINGGWDGVLWPDGRIFFEADDGYEESDIHGKIVWEGVVPKEYAKGYCEAIRWINQQIGKPPNVTLENESELIS